MKQRTNRDTPPRSYIVRIYRTTGDSLVGYAQDVLTGRVRAFRSLAELWSALGGRSHSVRSDSSHPLPTADEEPS